MTTVQRVNSRPLSSGHELLVMDELIEQVCSQQNHSNRGFMAYLRYICIQYSIQYLPLSSVSHDARVFTELQKSAGMCLLCTFYSAEIHQASDEK